MWKAFFQKLQDKVTQWLIYEPPTTDLLPYDFDRLQYEVRPGDVLLVEGRSRISRLIRAITQSSWTHAALYIGRIIDIQDPAMQDLIKKHINVKETTPLIIEDMLDQGTIIVPLSKYKNHHLRICRPIGITPTDVQLVIQYALKSLGQPYNLRHVLDLARFLLPWTLLPRRWGSCLFRRPTGEPESGICSTLIAEAFSSVQFPILPFIKSNGKQGVELFQRNPYLFTPKDFDYSPYFEIIKYPLFNPEEPLPYYRRMPWTKSGFLHQDHGILTGPTIEKPKKKLKLFQRPKKAENQTPPSPSSKQDD